MRTVAAVISFLAQYAFAPDPNWQNIAGTGSGVICIATALLPNNRLFCFERPHMPPVSFIRVCVRSHDHY